MKLLHYIYYLDKKFLIEQGRQYTIGRHNANDIVLSDKTVSRKHCMIKWEDQYPVLEDLKSSNGILINYKKTEKKSLTDNDRIIIGSFNLIYRAFNESNKKDMDFFNSYMPDTLVMEQKIANIIDHVKEPEIIDEVFELKNLVNKFKTKLNFKANTDKLTGLNNRRTFDEQIRFESERAKRYKHNLCLILIDIDDFKKVNDNFGHQKGDDVLRFISGVIHANIRMNDISARYGGEEFAVILTVITNEQAFKAAEKIREKVSKESSDKLNMKNTISLGVASIADSDYDTVKLIKNADDALYSAKRAGKNRTVFYNKDGV